MSNFNPRMVLVGNAAAGKAYFNGKGGCTKCHSVKKDLAGVGAMDPKTLQDTDFCRRRDRNARRAGAQCAAPHRHRHVSNR